MKLPEQTQDRKRDYAFSDKEYRLIRELAEEKKSRGQELPYESFEGYELPPRTQFPMLKKPNVSIKYGKITFNAAAVRLFESMPFILPVVHAKKKRLAVIPLAEEESASVEWARRRKDGAWVGRTISSLEFVEKLFRLLAWNRTCRYKILGRIAASDQGIILVFDLEEAVMFAPDKTEYTDPLTGKTKQHQMMYFPDAYKNRIGRSYLDYAGVRQMNLFEDIFGYQSDVPASGENDDVQNSAAEEPVPEKEAVS